MLFRYSIILFATIFIINDNICEISAAKVKYSFRDVANKLQDDKCPFRFYKCKMVKNSKKERALDCELKVTKASANDLKITVLLLNKIGNGWAQSSLVQERDKDFCEYIERSVLKSVLDPLFGKSDIGRTCPHEAGTYHINSYLPENLPDVKEGSYKVLLQLIDKGNICNEIEIGFDVEKKMDK